MEDEKQREWTDAINQITMHRERMTVARRGAPWDDNFDISEVRDNILLAADAELTALRAERDRLREALRCTSENCSEFGHIHDGDCSACPQGIIRRRAYGEGE